MFDGAELGKAIAAHPDDVEAALTEYEQAMFPRSAEAAAEAARDLRALLRRQHTRTASSTCSPGRFRPVEPSAHEVATVEGIPLGSPAENRGRRAGRGPATYLTGSTDGLVRSPIAAAP